MEEKIFDYETNWLKDRIDVKYHLKEALGGKDFGSENYESGKNLKSDLASVFIDKKFKVKKTASSLIDIENVEDLKQKLKINPFSDDSVFNNVIKLSKYCIVEKIENIGKKCEDDKYYRQMISFITTKKNSLKLKYLNEQEVNFGYISIDYEKVKFSEDYEKVGLPDGLRAENANVMEYLDKFRKSDDLEQQVMPEKINNIYYKYYIEKKFPEANEEIRWFEIKSENYYKKMFERFASKVLKNLKLQIDLNDWTYCVVFYSPPGYDVRNPENVRRYEKWCEIGGRRDPKLIQKFLFTIIMQSFKSPEVVEKYIYNKVGNMTDFSLMEYAFKNYPNGGYWIKKIVAKNKKYVEEVEGPYDKNKGEKRVEILRNITQIKNNESASLYTFDELTCNRREEDYYYEVKTEPSYYSEFYDIMVPAKKERNLVNKIKDKENFVEPENTWKTPPGALLFCLVNKMSKVVYFKKQDTNKNFVKFKKYALNSGCQFMSTFDYFIYFNKYDKESITRAKQLKIILSSKDQYPPENFIWMLDSVLNKSVKRGIEPENTPFTLSKISIKDGGKVTYEELKKFYIIVKDIDCDDMNNRMNYSFSELVSMFDFGFIEKIKNLKSPEEIKTVINLDVIIDKDDLKPKKFKVIKNFDTSYEISLKRFRKHMDDISLFSVKNIKNCIGTMFINFKNVREKNWETSRLKLVSNDLFFDNEITLLALTLFVSKSIGVKKIYLNTDLETSECDNSILFYQYIVYYLSQGGFYELTELGFFVENEREIDYYMSNIIDTDVRNFCIDNKIHLSDKDAYYKEDRYFTLSEFCQLYTERKTCPSKGFLTMLKEITNVISKNINLKIYNNLDDLSFEMVERYIKHNKQL